MQRPSAWRHLLALVLTTSLASVSPAAASVTLGQLSSAHGACGSQSAFPADLTQLSVTSGNSYRVPGNGAITSWSHNAYLTSTSVTMKVFRKVAEPNFYRAVGHDTRPVTGGLLNTFATSIPVQTGDLIGLNAPDLQTECTFGASPGDMILSRGSSDLHDDEQASFTSGGGYRVNISAVFVPSNTAVVETPTRNKKKGTATLNLTLPNPGQLTASGKGLKVSPANTPVEAGAAQLLIEATGKKKHRFRHKGRVKLSAEITYVPTNGEPGVQSVPVVLFK
ncbi:MAG: hypothetical protein QOD60_524 [Solirubrobacterales bacterium]|nr:hypothetical protein [Solirubrobacterales bacterium]